MRGGARAGVRALRQGVEGVWLIELEAEVEVDRVVELWLQRKTIRYGSVCV